MPRVQQIIARSAVANAWASSRMASAGTPVSRSAYSRVYGSTAVRYDSNPSVAWPMNRSSSSPAAMISRPTALARAMSLPTSSPSQVSAHSALLVRRGSTAYSRAPLWTALRTWWKKIGCVSRALLPHRTIRSVSSTSRYELVPPPAPNTVARPATLGACQVRLQLSMLLLPSTARLNFWAAKLTSLVAFEHENTPKVVGPLAAFAAWKPATTRSSASSQLAGRNWAPFESRTSGWVSRT